MRVLKIVSLSGLAGAFVGCLYGPWYCSRMHTDNPGMMFTLKDSVYSHDCTHWLCIWPACWRRLGIHSVRIQRKWRRT